MRSFMRFLVYTVLIGGITFFLYDSYQLYGNYKELKNEEAAALNSYNELLLLQNESKPLYTSNTDIAMDIVKMPACHLQNCYLYLEDGTDPVSISKVGEIGDYVGVKCIEYVLIIDSDTGFDMLEDLQIPINDVVIEENLAILNVPSLET